MAPNSPSTNTDCVKERDMMHVEDNSMLLRYLYDNTSFSDRLVELTVVYSTNEVGHVNSSDLANVGTAQKKKNDKS
ncbi:hypothetical protein Neosp_008183 [[Neocosmospora] mangrovei]